MSLCISLPASCPPNPLLIMVSNTALEFRSISKEEAKQALQRLFIGYDKGPRQYGPATTTKHGCWIPEKRPMVSTSYIYPEQVVDIIANYRQREGYVQLYTRPADGQRRRCLQGIHRLAIIAWKRLKNNSQAVTHANCCVAEKR
jgi:hypothetical protein